MTNERLLRGTIVLVLLGMGVLIAHLHPTPLPPKSDDLGGALWLGRQADLVLQLGLMLVAAFGIRALLPGEEEDQPDDDYD